MPSVEILDVTTSPLDSERLWGVNIDAPLKGSRSEGYSFQITGWVLGKTSRPATIQLMHFDRSIRTVPVSGIRTDVAAHFPHVAGAETSGFNIDQGVIGLRPQFEVRLEAVLEDESRVLLGTIRGAHGPLKSEFQPKIQPLMVTTMGRTGSTLMMRLLAAHPRIVVDRKYPFETRAASYWMHMLRVLSDPANPFQSARPTDFHSNLAWVGHHPFHAAPATNTPEIRAWFKSTYPERLAAFCQQCIEEFYAKLAGSQERNDAVYFAEKLHNGYIPWLVWEIYPRAREIVLVRDPRDMLCSMLAFNDKQGTAGFGRHRAGSDHEYVRQLGKYAGRLHERWKIRSDRAMLVRYEDLILQPEDTLTSLLNYLGLEASAAAVGQMLDAASQESSDFKRHRTTPDPKESIGRWKRDLDPALLPACEEAFGEVLKKFGYEIG